MGLLWNLTFILSNSTTATRVYGQGGSFTTNNSETGAVSASSLAAPGAVIVDSSGGVYISSSGRVLYYSSGSTTATRVYGQGGNFTTSTINLGGITANSLSGPAGLALDSNNGLYVADYSTSRVLYYPSGSTTATRVYGQLGSFTNSIVDPRNVTADTLYTPTGVIVDKSDNLYVADTSNNRVLYYPSGSIVPTKVYGQSDFTSSSTLNTSNSSLGGPNFLTLDSNGGLYVSTGENRVVYFPSGSTTATKVYGQGGSFTSRIQNNGGVSANSLSNPTGMAIDSIGRLYIADFGNSRILYY